MPRIQFATESWVARALPVSCERTIKCYAEREPPDAKTPIAVFCSPGITAWATVGAGPIRGMHVLGSTLYVVSAQSLYSVSSTGTVSLLGAGILGSGVVDMNDNGVQVMVVNGTGGWVWNPSTSTYTAVNSPAFFPANTITFFDEYFVFERAGTNEFFLSNILLVFLQIL